MPGIDVSRPDCLVAVRILAHVRARIGRCAQTEPTRPRELLVMKALLEIRFGKQNRRFLDTKLIGNARVCNVPGIWSNCVWQLCDIPRRIGANAKGVLR